MPTALVGLLSLTSNARADDERVLPTQRKVANLDG